MILTRRGLLAGTFSTFAGSRFSPAWAAEAGPELKLDAVQGVLQLRADGPETAVARFAGAEPAPVLRVRQGEAQALRIRNSLSTPMSLQLRGIRGQGSLDDPATAAAQAVAPGTEALLRFTPTESGTAWFRPRLDTTDQAAHGLGGVLIVDHATGGPLVDEDFVVFLQDWTVDDANRLTGVPAGGATVITVNGRPIPEKHTVRPSSRVRLRLVNGSTSRAMIVSCEGAKPLIAAIDGQPSELFEPIRDTVPVGPGARYDLLLDMSGETGKELRLLLRGTERVGGVLEPDRLLLSCMTDGVAVPSHPPIAALPANPALPPKIPLEAAKRAELTLAQAGATWTVNGVAGVGRPRLPILRVKQGDSVVLGFTNASKTLVPLTVEGQAMRLLHANDDGWEPYWRDTLLLPAGSRSHVAFLADKPGRWQIESGFAAQAVAGLRCWFEVLRA